MLTQIINGKILTNEGWLEGGSIILSDSKILEITNSDLPRVGAQIVDVKGDYILPGFVAMNIHGGGGHAYKEGTREAFDAATSVHLKHGATTIFPTIYTAKTEKIYNSAKGNGFYLSNAAATVFQHQCARACNCPLSGWSSLRTVV